MIQMLQNVPFSLGQLTHRFLGPGKSIREILCGCKSVSEKAGPSQMGRGGADARSSEAPNTGSIQASGDAEDFRDGLAKGDGQRPPMLSW
jgi:hypothetical protein